MAWRSDTRREVSFGSSAPAATEQTRLSTGTILSERSHEMNNTILFEQQPIHIDSSSSDASRREALYRGDLFLYSPRSATAALAEFAREMICEGFKGKDPTTAQFEMPVEEFVRIFAPIKPAFIHHPKTMQLMRSIAEEFGCDVMDTHLDVPRLRAVTSNAYLTSGVGYAHHPHRDTWYSAPLAQINWWLPLYPITMESTIAFHPRYWAEPIANGSSEFNYYEWNRTSRANAAAHIKSDTRPQPKATEPVELHPEIRLTCEAGGAILFSAAQMHSTVPNTSGLTRFSIDFRTVSLADLKEKKSAPNIDSRPVGTSLRDFVRCADLEKMPEEVVADFDNAPAREGEVLVYQPN